MTEQPVTAEDLYATVRARQEGPSDDLVGTLVYVDGDRAVIEVGMIRFRNVWVELADCYKIVW